MDTPSTRRGPPGAARRAAAACTALLFVRTGPFRLAGPLGAPGWRLDLAAHFRVHYAVPAALALGLALALRRRRTAAIAALVLAAELAQIAPFWLMGQAPAGPPAL